MAQLVLAVAGAVVGGIVGGPSGAQAGWLIGSAIGGSMSKGPSQHVEGPKLYDLKVTGTEYGICLPRTYGRPRLAGQLAYASDRRQVAHTTSTSAGGGKGGGGGSQTVTSTTYTYDVDLFILLTDNEIKQGISRIWENGKLIYNAGGDPATIAASNNTSRWARITIYKGAADQLPDPTYEAAVGSANALAYRGRGGVFIESYHLGSSGAIPNLTFELGVKDSSLPADTKMLRIATSVPAFVAASGDSHWAEEIGGYVWSGNVYALASGALVATRDQTSLPTIEWKLARDGLGSYGDTAVGGGIGSGYLALTNAAAGTHAAVYTMSGRTFGECAAPFGLSSYLYATTYEAGGGLTNAVRRVASGGLGAVLDFQMPANSRPHALAYKHAGSALTLWSCGNNTITDLYAIDGTTMLQIYQASYDAHGSVPKKLTYYAPLDKLIIQSEICYTVHDVASRTSPARVDFTHAGDHCFDAERYGFWVIAANRLYFHDIATGRETEEASFYTTATANYPGYTWTAYVFASSNWLLWMRATSGGHTDEFIYVPDDMVVGGDRLVDVVSDLCLGAGLQSGQFDASTLSAITKPVRALAVSQVSPTRATLDMLMGSHYFELTLSDKLYFRPRGGAAVVTIPYADLGASLGGNPVDPLPLHQATDIELPAQIALSYANVDNDYQTDTQISDRLVTAVTNTVQTMQMALGMTAAEAKGIVDTAALDQQVALVSTSIALLGDYALLEPTDVVNVIAKDGSSFRIRLTKRKDSYPLLEFDAVFDDASVLIAEGITSTDSGGSTTVAGVTETLMELMDIPILSDADNDAGFYVATKGVTAPYPGSNIYSSADDVTFEYEDTVAVSGIFGTCTTTLGDWTGPRVFDELNSVTIDIGAGTTASVTRAEILADQSINAWLIGSEILQARDATLISTGVYQLTGLLRGGRGTEWAMTGHAASERCVRVQSSVLRRIDRITGDLGFSRWYKGVTLGSSLGSATAQAFTDLGVGLKPFRPTDLRAARNGSGDISFTWQRRTRLATRFIGPLGISVPLGEDAEAYDVLIYSDNTRTTLLRTLSASTTSVTYTSAQQTADFGSNQATVYARIYQRSARVGRGYPLEAAA